MKSKKVCAKSHKTSSPRKKRRSAEEIHEAFAAKQKEHLMSLNTKPNTRSQNKNNISDKLKHCEEEVLKNKSDIQEMKKTLETGLENLKGIITSNMRSSSNAPRVLIVNTHPQQSDQIKSSLKKSSTSYNEIHVMSELKQCAIDSESGISDKSRSIKYHTTIFEEPTVIRKFRPPISKYKLKALQAAKDVTATSVPTSTVTSGALLTSTEIIEPEIIESEITECKSETLDIEEEEISVTESTIDTFSSVNSTTTLSNTVEDNDLESIAVDQSSHTIIEESHIHQTFIKEIDRFDSLSKFKSINAWMARKQAGWCVKKTSVLNKMLSHKALVSTYKCMSKSCSYTTISTRNFTTHLLYHEKESQDLDQLYHCPYCFFKGNSIFWLMKHYKMHFTDRYQCGYCFYRSSATQSCWEHVKTYHAGSPIIVYECPLSKLEANMNRLDSKREAFVHAFNCRICKLGFYLIDAYEKHLGDHSEDSKTVEEAKKDLMIYQHLLNNNKAGIFQCLFCYYGTDKRLDFRSHMQEHPREQAYACMRKNPSDQADPYSLTSTVLHEFLIQSNVKTIQCDISIDILKNTAEVSKIFDA